MPDRREISGDTDRLIQLMCDGIASESDRKVLGDAMLRDPRVLERYVDAIHLCVELPEFTAGPIRETEHPKTDGSCDAADEQRSTLAGSRANRWFFVGAIAIAATLLVGVTIMFGAWSGGSVATTSTSQDNQQPSNNRYASPAPSDSDYVARVIYESPDLQWIEGEAPTDFLLRLPAEQVLSISRGVLEIEFHSQARVILQAPATFVPLGRDSGRLVDGRLTGRAEIPGFLLEAGSVNVVDLGTEFGVVVDEHSGTDTHVFDGEVEVQLDPTDTSGEKMLLREGMSASVDAGGTPKTAEDSIAGRFIRNASPSRRADELSGRLTLIDLISGSTGFEQRFAGAINPNTGAWDLENPLYRDDGHKGDRLGDGSFHPATYSDFVDGTFAPAVGQDKIRIDSAGSLCDVGAIDGEHYGPIWVRRKSSLDQSVSFNADFWGTDTLRLILDQLSNAREGIMGVHPNAGITIDVSRIRDRLGVTPTRFEATSINLEKVISRGRNKTADLRVLCDGKVSYSRVGFGAIDGPERISVEIAEDTRFLTIFSTDGGDRITYDHVVLVDPLFLFH